MQRKILAGLMLCAAVAAPSLQADVNDKSDMQPIIQLDFGPYGSHLPGDGQNYCYPTSASMLLFWLHDHGFSQLATDFSTEHAQNLDLVLGGLMNSSASGGTTNGNYQSGLTDYLNARGISSSLVTWDTSLDPDLDWFNRHNDSNTVTLAALSWFNEIGTSGTYVYSGGHGTALVKADSGSSTLTVNNPYPSTFANVPNLPSSDPQTATVLSISGSILMTKSGSTLSPYEDASKTYMQISTPIIGPPNNPSSLAVYDTGISLTIADAAKPLNAAYVISAWEIDTLKVLNTGGGKLEVIAPLTGMGGINKEGDGELQLQSTNALTGSNTIVAGKFSSNQTSGTPFGTGGISIKSGALVLIPDDSVPSAVSVTIASGSDQRLDSGGGAALIMNRGANTSLTVTIGGYTSGTDRNIYLHDRGTLVLSSTNGAAELGGAIKVFTAGGTSNAPDSFNGMVQAAQVAQDNDTKLSGSFLTYSATNGYAQAATTGGDINSATATTIYRAATDQTIVSGGTASVYALEVDHANIGGAGATLNFGTQEADRASGIIMNGGTISAGTISNGAAIGFIYTSKDDGTISSAIAGTGDLVKFGPGTLTFSGNSAGTHTGDIYINSGGVVVAVSGATGPGTVEVRNGATLAVAGVVSGSVRVLDNAVVTMNSGTISGGLTVHDLGTVRGTGFISGTTTIFGSIASGTSSPGTLTFGGPTTIENKAQIYWSLSSTFDNHNGTAGTDWNSLNFENTVQIGEPSDSDHVTIFLNISGTIDPNSGNSFWDRDHDWTFATGGTTAFADMNLVIENWSWTSGTFNWARSDDQSELIIQFKAVPEPGAIAMLLLGVLLFATSRAARRNTGR